MFEESKDPVMMELWDRQVPVDQWPNECRFVRTLRTYIRQIIRTKIFGGE